MEKPENKYMRQIRNVLVFVGLVLLLTVLKVGGAILLPLVIAIFVFVLVNPILSKLDRIKFPNILSIIVVLLVVLSVSILILGVVFQMVNMLLFKLGDYAERVNSIDHMLSGYVAKLFDEDPADFSILSSLNIDWFGIAKTYLSSFSTKFMSIVSDGMMVFVYLLFMLMERKSFAPKLRDMLPRKKGDKFIALASRMNKQVAKYLTIKIVISAATGVMFYLIALMTGLDFALIWGVLAFVLNFIPTIGSIIVTGAVILMSIVQFLPNWSLIIYIAVLMTATEMILGNIIDPKLQGVRLNISPMVILVSLAVWGFVWGIVGMFLAVPLTSMIQIVCANIPSLKNVAIFLSTGRTSKKEVVPKNGKRRKREEDDGWDLVYPESIDEEDIDPEDLEVSEETVDYDPDLPFEEFRKMQEELAREAVEARQDEEAEEESEDPKPEN